MTLSTLIIGLVFVVLLAGASYKSYKSAKNNSCPGCSGGCSVEKQKNCH